MVHRLFMARSQAVARGDKMLDRDARSLTTTVITMPQDRNMHGKASTLHSIYGDHAR
jgi:hypothetical protein